MTTREPPSRLGRGLAALLGEDGQVSGGDVRRIPVDLLEPNRNQPRRALTQESLQELALSIRAQGILQPLLARPHPDQPGRFELVAGERRWRAAQLIGLPDVPVLVRGMDDRQSSAAALVENLQRQDLDVIEEARGYARLLSEFGMTHEQLADAIGRSRSYVTNTLRMLNLHASVQSSLQRGEISMAHARALLAHPKPAEAVLAIVGRGLSVRQTEAMVKRDQGVTPSRMEPRSVRDADVVAMERQLSQKLGLLVQLSAAGQGGSVRIVFRDLDQLEGLYTLLMAP